MTVLFSTLVRVRGGARVAAPGADTFRGNVAEQKAQYSREETITARVIPAAKLGAQTPAKIHALTSLRFFAALFVVFYHLSGQFFPAAPHGNILSRFIGAGFVSVSFFFLLSGYILAIVYLRRGAVVPIRSFYVARFARVYPLYLLTLLLDTPHFFHVLRQSFALKAALESVTLRFAANALMLQAWFPSMRGIDSPNWSLSVEAIFYAIFPFVGMALWKLQRKALWLAGLALYLGGQLFVLLVVPHVSPSAGKFLPILHTTTFVLGVLVARWQVLHRKQGVGDDKPEVWILSAILTMAVVAFGGVVYWLPQIPVTSLYDGLLAPVFVCVIWVFSGSTWLPSRVLGAPWLVALGEASFGLYLFHIPVFHFFERLGWTHRVMLFPLYLAFTISVSLVSFYWFETPMRRWILMCANPIGMRESTETASDAQ